MSTRDAGVLGYRRAATVAVDWIALTRTFGLYFATAIAELIGCYLPLLWLTGKGGGWLLLPAALSLAMFVWLLALHPAASGRVYASYGAVYIAAALIWLWLVDGIAPAWTDVVGVALALTGAGVIALGHVGD